MTQLEMGDIDVSNGDGTKSKKKDPIQQALRALEQLSGTLASEDNILFQGNQYILPAYDDLSSAIDTLKRKLLDDETLVNMTRTFSYLPWDGAHAFLQACKKHFGFVNSKQFRPASFFNSEQGTQWVDIPTGPNGETTQVPWGEVYSPIVPEAPFYLSGVRDGERGILFQVSIQCARKHRRKVDGLFNLIQRELEENSLYRGQAFDGQDMPQFLDLRGVDPLRVVFPRDLEVQLNQNVFSVFTHTERLRENGVPLKRAVLFTGYYGTGKTIAGYMAARMATANGWTFIYCRPQDDLQLVLQRAKLYAPAAVLYEDVDTVAAAADTTSSGISRVLDAFDGIRAKGTELMVILTTNHVDKLHKGMVRPGRLDGIIPFGLYDGESIERLISVTVGPRLAKDVDWSEVIPHFSDLMPAFIVEAAQRAVRFALLRDANPTITGQDLIDASNDLRPQLELMADAPEMSERDRLGGVFENLTAEAAEKALLAHRVSQIGEPVIATKNK